MKTIILVIFSAFLVLPLIDSLSVSNTEFKKLYAKCLPFENAMLREDVTYNLNDDYKGLSLIEPSVESLIGIIEKIEQKYLEKNQRLPNYPQLAAQLLKSYRLDGVEYKTRTQVLQSSGARNTDKLEDLLLGTIAEDKLLSNLTNFLQLDEECALHKMLSHNFTEVRNGENTQAIEFFENGIGSFKGHPQFAVVLNKLLLGVIAGGVRDQKSLNDLLPKRRESQNWNGVTRNTDAKNDKIDLVDAILYGDLIEAVINEGRQTPQTKGTWQKSTKLEEEGTICKTRYQIESVASNKDGPSLASQANLNGAYFGRLIGKEIQERTKNSQPYFKRLSQILRLFFYDGQDSFNLGLCKVANENNFALSQIKSVLTDYRFLSALPNERKDAEEDIDQALSRISQSNLFYIDPLMCTNNNRNNDNGKCESRSNILIVLPSTAIYQKVANQLINSIELGEFRSTVSIYEPKPSRQRTGQGKDKEKLESIVHNATYSGCIGCNFTLIRDSTSINSDLMLNLISTVEDFRNERLTEFVVPSTNVIIFDKPKSSALHLESFHRKFPETKLIVVDKNKDNSDDNYESITINGNLEKTIEDLKEKLCLTPQIMQVEFCNNTKKDDEYKHNGFISPGHAQYFMIQPKYFLKSFTIYVKVEVEEANTKLKFCHSNAFNQASNSREASKCATATKEDPAVIKIENPCKKKNVDTCPPMYFMVENTDDKRGTKNDNLCLDEECRKVEQTKFILSQKGMFCSGSFNLVSSFSIFSIALITYIFSFNYKKF